MRGSIWLVLILAVFVVTLVLQRRRSRRAVEPFLPLSPAPAARDTERAAAQLLGAMDAHPAGVPDPAAPHDLTLRVLVAWPVDAVRELVVVPEGILIRTDGVTDLRGIGGDPGWAPLLPLLVEWTSAVHADGTLASIRGRVAQLAGA